MEAERWKKNHKIRGQKGGAITGGPEKPNFLYIENIVNSCKFTKKIGKLIKK